MRQKLKIIALSPENYNELKKYGQAGDSLNDALTNVLKQYSEIVEREVNPQ